MTELSLTEQVRELLGKVTPQAERQKHLPSALAVVNSQLQKGLKGDREDARARLGRFLADAQLHDLAPTIAAALLDAIAERNALAASIGDYMRRTTDAEAIVGRLVVACRQNDRQTVLDFHAASQRAAQAEAERDALREELGEIKRELSDLNITDDEMTRLRNSLESKEWVKVWAPPCQRIIDCVRSCRATIARSATETGGEG